MSAIGLSFYFAYCDQGYRGHGAESGRVIKIVGRTAKLATRAMRGWMTRRASVEPTIGHLKCEHRLCRNHLKGVKGNEANVVLAAAGYNLAKLLTWFYCAWIIGVIATLVKLRSRPKAAPDTTPNILFQRSS